MWYEDETLNIKSNECDLAYDNENSPLLLKLSEECRILAEDENTHIMIRSKLYYDSFTSLSNYLEMIDVNGAEREKYVEKILYLCRRSLLLQEEYFQKNTMKNVEEANFNGIHFRTIVNYANILSHIGRLPKAIFENRKVALQGFGMAIGNLGMELYDYGYYDYDTGHQQLILEKVCSLFKNAISLSEEHVHEEAKKRFLKQITDVLGTSNFKEKLKNIPDLDFFYKSSFMNGNSSEDFEEGEHDYRKWIAQNNLALNTLNDLDYSINQAYDPVHLPDMIVSATEKYPRLHGLFNQIKQEYCSARFMIYDGIQNNNVHFSDKNVFLVNTLDYPIYGYSIEKVKSSYRTIYSLFDRIGYFLNEYFSLGQPLERVSFGSVWNKSSNLHKKAESNYLLKALYWMKKDLYGNSISEYKDYIDPVLNKTYQIRNIMEHRYLKILSFENFLEEDYKFDEIATVISLEEFQKLSINLLRTSREAIILLVMLINVEEKRKKSNSNDSVIPSVFLPKYEDEWKF
ncbi:LA2681 family HEPN domain-containing protein [Marinilactibacillus psychrotolerans]|uniref:LA2681 family HEPN domain-containing protein n=1 Tax=Marinilactibacillus psychrotolerans TaxID=191770 RepID=UPI0037FE976E